MSSPIVGKSFLNGRVYLEDVSANAGLFSVSVIAEGVSDLRELHPTAINIRTSGSRMVIFFIRLMFLCLSTLTVFQHRESMNNSFRAVISSAAGSQMKQLTPYISCLYVKTAAHQPALSKRRSGIIHKKAAIIQQPHLHSNKQKSDTRLVQQNR